MASSILIVCPKCGKQIKAPENALGKKVRCKYCQEAFVVRKGEEKAPATKPMPKAPTTKAMPKGADPESGKKGKPPGKKGAPKLSRYSLDDEDEEAANPYRLEEVSLAPRCPDCAEEIDEGQVICLHCGYNLRTRQKGKTRKIYDLTFWEHLKWLSPGIACALAVLSLIGFNAWYLAKINDLVSWETDSFFVGVWSIGGIKLWIVIMSLGLIWFAGKFAVKRLIFHPKPPEIEKLK